MPPREPRPRAGPLPDVTAGVELTDPAQLRELVGDPIGRVADKVRSTLHRLDVDWLAASPFCALATSDAGGNMDVSPKGDPPGFTRVLDERTIALPDRPGNRRVDGLHNILANPRVGLLFLIPGRGDTLRINGRARLLLDAPFFDDMAVKGHRPAIVTVIDIDIDEVFYHCATAFLPSKLWDETSWQPDAAPSRPQIAQSLERPDETLQTLQSYYGPDYADRLYST